MQGTQIELPQLSLQRYLDLLRRRRWQVIPVSLFGLLVGGLVAFFIPRYYVANVLIEHQQVPGASAVGKDPVKAIVDTARQTFPLAVGETIDHLRWPESRITNPYERAQAEREVRSRLHTADVNPDPDRSYAQLHVTFRDLDGKRAAAFLNALVQIWRQKRLDEMRQVFERDREEAKVAHERYEQVSVAAQQDRRDFERRYGIDPHLSVETQKQLAQQDRQELLRLKGKLLEQQQLSIKIAGALELARALLATTPPRVVPTQEDLIKIVSKHREGPSLAAKIISLKDHVDRLRDNEWHKRQLAAAVKQLKDLLGPDVIDEVGMIANPVYKALEDDIKAKEIALAALELEIASVRKTFEDDKLRLDMLIEGFSKYEDRTRHQTRAEEQREANRKRMEDADLLIARLGNEQTIRIVEPAREPPRPTEPNILVVSLIGCVLGLALAVAMILLLDVLQGAFKSIEDVEDGLPVPVLGGISHLETEEERQRAIRTRRRTTVTAAAFVCVCVALVLLFYADPTRLPPVVRDLLALLLGA
jgi:capsular polysaccharide biosynthesis protein